ncbi:glycosyltransferase [Trypanosoma grayi]|uniref:glycosyltransferase n=1 Tax=Trypanosoma grayi TaxID=71804 RepID=UPI0004F41F99|nr:glycosyltransferase [Trypanosoma grayi]KEG15164.1 glycosyltransferase [Trypanosoma grayi]
MEGGMFNYDNLIWTISFPLFCSIALWFSMDLALLVRSEGGRCRREAIRESIAAMERRGEPVLAGLRRNSKAVLRRALVVVGGDFARSPRMQYHAASLAACGMFDEVVLVGFDMGNTLIDALKTTTTAGHKNNNNSSGNGSEVTCVIKTEYLISPILPPSWFSWVFPHPRLYWIASAVYRVCVSAVAFAWVLICASTMVVNGRGQLLLVDLILVQSPPAVPFVPVIKYLVRPYVFIANTVHYYFFIVPASWMSHDAMSEIRGGLKLQQQQKGNTSENAVKASLRSVMCPAIVVDWHNFGYTIMQSDGRPSLMVWLYRLIECNLCRGNRNLTVSKAMRTILLSPNMKVSGTTGESGSKIAADVAVLYDTAPSFFGPVSRTRFAAEVLMPALRLTRAGREEKIGLSPPPAWFLHDVEREEAAVKSNRSGLFMIAATSWTVDDDYSIVVDALKRIDTRLQQERKKEKNGLHSLKPLWLLVTGKGASRARFEQSVAAAHLSSLVTVTTIYFQSYTHYAMALGAADVGLCLHHSSSGLDLPMKAVDMLGSGLPVAALRYDALAELLDSKRGWMFSNAEELEEIFCQNLLPRFEQGDAADSLGEARFHVLQSRCETWDDKWRSVVLPLLLELL